MGNHCVPMVCSCCGHEYCVRCEFGICPKCGTPWDAKPASVDEVLSANRKNEQEMTVDEIFQATYILTKTEKMSLVNRILSSLSKKKPEPNDEGKDWVMPVHQALSAFDSFVFANKGVRYSPNGKFSAREYGHMKELLQKLEERMVESGVGIIDDKLRIETLKLFLSAVRDMQNKWFYENIFTPYGLLNNFEKIYMTLQTYRNHGQQSAFRYL